MLSQEEIQDQHELLIAHRRTLSILLKQQARYDAAAVPAHIISSIQDARSNIRQIKTILRQAGISVTDSPNDEEQTSAIEPTGHSESLHQTIYGKYVNVIDKIDTLIQNNQ